MNQILAHAAFAQQFGAADRYQIARCERFLNSTQLDIDKAAFLLKQHIIWREKNNIDSILGLQLIECEHIREFLPCGFHETDKKGRPIFILQFGAAKLTSLFDCCTQESILKYFIKEIETLLMVRTPKAGQSSEEIVLIIDMKAAKFKDLSNKQFNALFKMVVSTMIQNYPELLYRCYVVNTPMFLQDYWDIEIKPLLPELTREKVLFTGESSHSGLTQNVTPQSLPRLYGGQCDCQATCVYSNKGPWTDKVNLVNFQDRDQHGDLIDEEYKYEENDSEGEEDYQQINDEQNEIDLDERLADLKGQLQMNFGIAKKRVILYESDGINDDDVASFDMDTLQKMLQGGSIKGKPDETPMNTEIEDGE